MYEILPAGIEELEKINSKGVQHSELILEKKSPEKDVFELLDEILLHKPLCFNFW